MRFVFTQRVGASPDIVQEFYSDIRNLERISPPFPHLHIDASDTRIMAGRTFDIVVDFRLVQFRWSSHIDAVVQGEYFVDTFRGRILKSWRHLHRYEREGAGTLLTDDIECDPAWWFVPGAWLFVRVLFAFRRGALAKALS